MKEVQTKNAAASQAKNAKATKPVLNGNKVKASDVKKPAAKTNDVKAPIKKTVTAKASDIKKTSVGQNKVKKDGQQKKAILFAASECLPFIATDRKSTRLNSSH